ncbi:MAG: S8 family serine peptidase, partial [Thermomicrobiales bacterium]
MIQHARRPLALVAVLALLLTAITPALALGPLSPGFDESGNGFELNLRSASLKHPTLDSKLAGLVNDVNASNLSESAIARKAVVSRGTSVAVNVFVAGDPAETAAWLTAHSAEVDGVGVEMIEAYVPVAQLEALGGLAGVLAVRSTIPPFTKVLSQGVGLHGVTNWNQNGYTGAGVKVGVIDVGFDGIVSLIGSELPTLVARCYPPSGAPTANPADCDRDGVHGAAVSETVMDVAPQASLYVSNPGSWLELRETVTWMASQGVTVINHSVGWVWEGPGDGTSLYSDGPLATVDYAVANGITWVNAAGNEGTSTWSDVYQDADDDGILDFSPGNEFNAIQLYAGSSVMVVMRWEDSWPGASTDLDIALLDANANILAVGSEEQSGGPGDIPLEILTFDSSFTEVGYLGVVLYGGAEPDWVQLQEFNGTTLGLSNPAGSVGNPAESANPGLLAVGATAWMTPGTIEDFSSQGPTRDGRIKPDVVGIDQADTVSYGPSGFPGTSQASPHVAGLATLVKQRFPTYSPAEVAQYLRSNATQAHAPNNVWGYGLAYLPEIVENENPVPTISNVSPNSVSIGTYPLTVTVNGSGFVQGSAARWNGQDRPTTYVSANQLTFEIQHLDADHPSTIQITVNSPAPGGGVSNAVTLTITGGV